MHIYMNEEGEQVHYVSQWVTSQKCVDRKSGPSQVCFGCICRCGSLLAGMVQTSSGSQDSQ